MRAALSTAVAYLLFRPATSTPYVCTGCGRTWTRLTPAQCAQVGSRLAPTCRRLTCIGRLWPAPIEATDRLIRDLSKNGAPVVETGTPPNTTAVKEPTMAHTLQSENTPRGRQMAAALALFHLVESGPDEMAEWKVDEIGRLHGHVQDPRSDDRNRRALDAFAKFFGNEEANRSQGRNDNAEWVHLSTSGTYRDVPVNVWTHVGIRATNPYGGAS